MTNFGYTLMTEQNGPRELVRYATGAEEAGFDFEVMSDHFSPWLTEQGHAPYAWSVLGAVAHATSRVDLMTYVTCPTMRYHPAVVAQKAATVQLLAEGRFTLGWAAARTSTSTSSVTAGPASRPARRCSPRPSRSSGRCTPATWSPTAATTSTSTPPGSGTCPRSRSSSRWRSRATGPSSTSPRWPTTWSLSSPTPG